MEESKTEDYGPFATRLILAILIVGVALLLWELRYILVLAFGAILLGRLVDFRWRQTRRRLPSSPGAAAIVRCWTILCAKIDAKNGFA